MASTTVTTIVLVLFGLGLLALTAYAWLGSWDLAMPRPSRVPVRAPADDEVELAVRQMRQAIEDYERSQR